MSLQVPHPCGQSLRLIIDQPEWYGQRSGYYTQLPRALEGLGLSVEAVRPCRGLRARIAGKVWSTMWGLPRRRQTLTADEVRFHAGWLFQREKIAVMLSIEQHLPALLYWRQAPRRLIGTLHFPRAFWTPAQARMLSRLQSAVMLYRADLDFFAALIGEDRVRFAYHGVDTDFFRPADSPSPPGGRPILLCVGQFGRDFAQLMRIAPVILEKLSDAELYVVAAAHAQVAELAPELVAHPRVRLLSGVSDDRLLALYQSATVLLLPMRECGASNAIVEALACGLPIVTTDVGGIPDYGGGTLFPVVPQMDDAGLIDETVRLVEDHGRRRDMSEAMRAFAVARLTWDRVARDHLQAYHELVLST